jgi:arylsulfatase A-like enzyme
MKHLLAVLFVFLLSCTGWARRPNIILVMTDDQGYGDLACHGNEAIVTPNLDKLHAKSVRLTDFHVSPACAPTRAGLLTGRCPHRNGVWHVVMGRTQLAADEVTVAELFSEAGYRTAIFGKWHLGDNYPMRPQDQGFQEVLVHGGGVVGHTPDWWLNDYFDDTYLHNGKLEQCPGYCTDVWFERALKFIERNRDAPFLVYLPLNAPHQPFQVPDRYEALYRDKPNVPNAAFYGMITCIDENMGRLQAALQRWGLEGDTILIFTTDNGTSAGLRWLPGRKTIGFNAGMRGKKASAYDGGHRVPCWFRWPAGGLEGGRDVDRLADHVDILPTLLDLCDVQAPDHLHFDGTSLAPLLRGDAVDWPDRTLVAELQLVIDQPVKWQRTAVMTERWRLVGGEELYDIDADPGQKHNVAGEHPNVVDELRADYRRWWASVAESHDKIPEIVLGSDRQNPTLLTCYYWNNDTGQQRDMPWAHAHIVAGPLQNGYWWVKVDRAGTYRFTLRRWPVESGLAINATCDAVPAEKSWHPLQPGSLTATKARLKIQEVDETRPIAEDARTVTFTVPLRAGSTRLQTWLTDDRGNSRGAYYVQVERLAQSGKAAPTPSSSVCDESSSSRFAVRRTGYSRTPEHLSLLRQDICGQGALLKTELEQSDYFLSRILSRYSSPKSIRSSIHMGR